MPLPTSLDQKASSIPDSKLTRRTLLNHTALAVGAAALPNLAHAAEVVTTESVTTKSAPASNTPTWKYSLNMSTIRGQKLPLDQQITVAAKAGYNAIEPWIGEIEAFVKNGGSVADQAKRCRDLGLEVVSAIGFAQWIINDDEKRKAALEQARRDMDLVRQLGGTRIAAPPTGETNNAALDLFAAAKRYRALCDIGRDIGVTPQVEVWGFSKALSRLGEAVFVAIESGALEACVLPDIYHIYKGGSDFAGLQLLSGRGVQVFHINDYPAMPERAAIKDADRVYPGDGVAPLKEIFGALRASGFSGYLSLELFNPEYWKQDAQQVATTGLEKSKAAVAKALS
jgi:2-keto-myo-inositol isomerase